MPDNFFVQETTDSTHTKKHAHETTSVVRRKTFEELAESFLLVHLHATQWFDFAPGARFIIFFAKIEKHTHTTHIQHHIHTQHNIIT